VCADDLVLLTGATGYVGSRLLGVLRQSGRRLRLLVRKPAALAPDLETGTRLELVTGDLLDPRSAQQAMTGVHSAYYLVHTMDAEGEFEKRDRQSAANFAAAARTAGVERIIYLGGLGSGPGLSRHLESRQEVGRILRESGVTTVEFRASVIIGAGSASFEMIRALVEGLPAMVVPRWVTTLTQPVAIEDVVAYLLAVLDMDIAGSAIYEIGGPRRISYLGLMKAYARQRGLRRVFLPVPVLTPWLSGLWLALVTPLHARVGRRLIEGVRNETVLTDDTALAVFPIRPRGVEEAMAQALAEEDREFARIRWSRRLPLPGRGRDFTHQRVGSRLVDSRAAVAPVTPEQAFAAMCSIAGQPDWYCRSWPWLVRGYFDLAVGGPGLRCRAPDGQVAAAGDRVGPWRVDSLEPGSLLRLVAEMKLPGRAWLQFEIDAHECGAQIRQTAIFEPLGIMGLVYWYALLPVHQPVFRALLREIAAGTAAGGS